jgi:hypothetical protein
MFSPWHNRISINYAQWIIDYPMLREHKSGFVGEGEVYFSVIDDPEIEIMKALWEAENYLRNPPSRRLAKLGWFDRELYWQHANALAKVIEEFMQSGKTTVHYPQFLRGGSAILLAQAVPLTRLTVGCDHFPYAVQKFLEYCDRVPELSYVRNIIDVADGGYNNQPKQGGEDGTSRVEGVV